MSFQDKFFNNIGKPNKSTVDFRMKSVDPVRYQVHFCDANTVLYGYVMSANAGRGAAY